MNSIQLWLKPSSGKPTANLTAELYHSPSDPSPLFFTTILTETMKGNFSVTITFPPQNDPPNQQYFLLLKTSAGAIEIFGRSEDAYPDGQAYVDMKPIDRDLSFRASYDYSLAGFEEDIEKVISNLFLILPLIIVLWLPGRVLLNPILNRRYGNEKFDWGERTALSLGLSLSIIPLVMLWTTTLGLRWQRTAVVFVSLLIVVAFFWQSRSWLVGLFKIRTLSFPQVDPSSLALGMTFLFTLGVRFAMVRDLSAPAWVDSVHHATITRLILELGGFPSTYSPYVQSSTTGYHPGFHSELAFFQWLSGLDIPSGMLVFGQVLSALSVISVYLLTTTFTKNQLSGVVAALFSGVFTPMPAYYTSWGRYTQLAGLLILPAAMLFIKLALNGNRNFKILLMAGITAGGIFLTHYRVAAFLVCLAIAYLITFTLKSLAERSLGKGQFIWFGSLAIIVALTVSLTLPWWPSTVASLFAPRLAMNYARPAFFADFSWGFLNTAWGKPAMILAFLGLLLAILRHRWFSLTFLLWLILMFTIANAGALHLPGEGFVSNLSVEIMLFMPISTFAGYFIANLLEAGNRILPQRLRPVYVITSATLGMVVALFAAQALMPILNPITMLHREADSAAIQWIKENIPSTETILINPFLWGYGLYAGNDGGYWITPLAGIKTMPPPVLYGMVNTPENVSQITETCQQAIKSAQDPQALHELLVSQRIRYVYIGARGGALSPKLMRQSPLFKQLFADNGTWLFEVQ